jgi:hypothetical protein
LSVLPGLSAIHRVFIAQKLEKVTDLPDELSHGIIGIVGIVMANRPKYEKSRLEECTIG